MINVGTGNDRMEGGDGADTLTGAGSHDVLNGGAYDAAAMNMIIAKAASWHRWGPISATFSAHASAPVAPILDASRGVGLAGFHYGSHCFSVALAAPDRLTLQRQGGAAMKQASVRILPLVLVLLGAASAAVADCKDYPGPGVDWSGCDKSRRLLAEDDFRGANLSRADLSYTDMRGADFSGANLSAATMSRTRLAGANLSGADLTKTILGRADMTSADLTGAILVKAEMPRVILTSAKLGGANLARAEMGRAKLDGADLGNASLDGTYLARARLRGANLAGADLTEAELYLADLRGTDLSQTKGLLQEQLKNTCGDDTTKLPAGLAPSPGWPCTTAEEED